ncbi:MAG: hypothetical protein FWG05_00640 [Kiritimatiellaeota bacterium]|nr:hypothetical protein [Kiritimatiellota bacterium]
MEVKEKKRGPGRNNSNNELREPEPARAGRRVPRWALVIAACLLVPLSAALLRTLGAAEAELAAETTLVMSPTTLMFAAGFALATLLCVAFRNSSRPYIVAHELTHALFGWLSGARVSDLTLAKYGGKVNISKSNIMILLSPYFVPFYAFLLVLLYSPLSFFAPMGGSVFGRAYVLFIGLAWGHHFWWTLAALCQLQQDFREYGTFFSINLVIFANLLMLFLLFGLFSPMAWTRLFVIAGHETVAVFREFWEIF